MNLTKCETCKYFHRFDTKDAHSQKSVGGMCHRYPPNSIGWPLVEFSDVCGEYKQGMFAVNVALLGYCPTCGAKGSAREKRPDGNDYCSGNPQHCYPSKDALPNPPTKTLVERAAALANLPKAEQVRLEFSVDTANLRKTIDDEIKRVTANGPKLYCYHKQTATARDLLREIGFITCDVIPVNDDAAQLRGAAGGVLLVVEGHRNAVLTCVYDAAIRAGLMYVQISDAWLRAKAERVAR